MRTPLNSSNLVILSHSFNNVINIIDVINITCKFFLNELVLSLIHTMERNMDKNSFDLSLEFYLATKSGPAVSSQAKLHAKSILVNGDSELNGVNYTSKAKAKALATKIQAAYDRLKSWDSCGTSECKYLAYTMKSVKRPSIGAFTATLNVISLDASVHAQAVAHNVNYQSIKVMKPRLEKYIKYAELLQKTF